MEALGLERTFWRGKTVLLTGHTGFKGGWLALWLRRLGAEVVGFALDPPTDPSFYEAARVYEGITCHRGDIRDFELLRSIIARHLPQIVFHLAAQPLVRDSYKDPVLTYSTNVLGTVHLLEAIRYIHSARVVINVTTDKCYRNREQVEPYSEDEALGGFDPYSSSKACSELVTEAYRRSYCSTSAIALASARAGNVIGGGDWARDRLVPDLVRAFSAKVPAVIRYPESVRPWQHVLDPLYGYLLLAQALWNDCCAYAEAWNFGPDESDMYRVSEVVENALAEWGAGATWTRDAGIHPHEARLLRLNSSKARARLNWRPRWHMLQALRQAIIWYKAFLAGEDMRAFSLRQIAEYGE